MIGILVADSNEIQNFPYDIIETRVVNQFTFTVFDSFVAVHSGIGIANASAATQELITSFDVEEIINYGAVGANQYLNVYDIVTPEKIFYHDVVTPWYGRGQTPGEKEFFVNSISSEKNNNLGSGSSFISSKEDLDIIKKELNVDIFDMETAGIAQIADKNNVKLTVIKVVSDSIGNTKTNIENINDRINKAGEIAFNETLKVLESIIT